MDAIETAMHALGRAFAAGLTRPGTAIVTLSRYGLEARTYDTAANPALIGGFDSAFLDTLKAAAGVTDMVVELSGSDTGTYVVSYATGLPSLPPRAVLDPAYRFPGHPAPGMPKPAAAINDGRPTDPAVLAEVQALVTRFSGRWRKRKFPPGYSEEEILAVENQLGVRLPEDVRALYRTIHHDPYESGLLGRFSPVPLEQIVKWYAFAEPDASLFKSDPVVFDSYPHGRVKRVARSDWWVTFAPDYGMNYAAVDLDPAPGGAYGQIIEFGRDVWGPVRYIAPSVLALLREPGLSESPAGPQPHTTPADADRTQHVHLRGTDEVILSDLAGLPHLRSITAIDRSHGATSADLAIPAGLPVEIVDIEAGAFDPGLLATTPTLRYVRLAGNTTPVSIAGLAALPELLRLDVSEAAVSDIAAVAAFPALKVLVLSGRQWTELLATGRQPSRLAGAAMGGLVGVREAVAWFTAIGGGNVEHRTVSAEE
ncbi:SMI1/KNR4 family protein [Winogradskya humida]|uniref:SMI1/KNR4 family protein n=1 Tax=Winogradskya humida TaxID=113566 RepID=UPI001941C6D8|nr:SMI1/KNR4 family protein [Actinoplanes humidus]